MIEAFMAWFLSVYKGILASVLPNILGKVPPDIVITFPLVVVEGWWRIVDGAALG